MNAFLSARRLRIFSAVGITLVLLLIAVHVILPVWLSRVVRTQLATMPEYRATFSAISVSLQRVSYTIHDARVFADSVSGKPVLEAREIELGVTGLKNGILLGRVTVRNPRVSFADSIDHNPVGINTRYALRKMARLMPIALNEIFLTDGHLYFHDLSSTPRLTFQMRNIHIHIDNLNGAPRDGDELIARANGKSDVYGGKLRFSVNFNPNSEGPEFNVRARLENMDLSYISDHLEVYGDQSIDKGLFSMLAEARGEEETVSGFVKPLLETTYMVSFPQAESYKFYKAHNPFARPYPQISFHGNMESASLSLWSAVAFTLRNAFLEALVPVIHKIDAGEKRRPRPQKVPSLPEKTRFS